ncbi:MAG: glycosyltransferase family 2 protein [Clostridiales bacterium]|nr:glycosyltransferase family 2 protein [Clostridiales bacterium]
MADDCIFIILSHNSEAYLRGCLDSVLALSAVRPLIYIADNGSSDASAGMIKDYAEKHEGQVDPLFLDKNLGTTVPRNRLIKKALKDHPDASYVCVLDSDTVINDDAVRFLKEALDSDKDVMIAAPRMFNGDGVEQMSVKKFPRLRSKLMKACPIKSVEEKGRKAEAYDFFPAKEWDTNIYEAQYAISACWFMRRGTYEILGPLDEKIFYAPEDVDYCATAAEKGGKVVLVSGARILHLTQRISKKKLISRMNFLHIKGLIYFSKKHRDLIKKL